MMIRERTFLWMGAFLLLATRLCEAQYHLPARDKALVQRNISYVDNAVDPEIAKSCRLDLYLPALKDGETCPLVVWCHGGGLTGGDKSGDDALGMRLLRSGIAMASVNYRLSPAVKYPVYVEDVATSVSWLQKNIVEPRLHGKVFIGGHSAGAYLSGLLAMDERYFKKQGVAPESIGGAILLSGQILTHFTVRAERGLSESTIISDEAAPVYYSRKATMPLLLMVADNDWPSRLEENQYFAAILKSLGNTRWEFHVIKERNHGSIYSNLSEKEDPGFQLISDFIKKYER